MTTHPDPQRFRLMQEHPDRFTDSELEAMMQAHDCQPDTAAAWHKFEQQHLTPHRRPLRWTQVAAAIAAIVVCAASLYAIISPSQPKPAAGSTPSVVVAPSKADPEPPCDPIRLDSLLDAVSAHYAKAVCFRDDDLRALRFMLAWEPDAPLDQLLERLNQFDGLRLSLRNDTIFVEEEEEMP